LPLKAKPPLPAAPGRHPEASPILATGNTSLNFKVDPAFRPRFRQRAAEADLKQNELLREALDAWSKNAAYGSLLPVWCFSS